MVYYELLFRDRFSLETSHLDCKLVKCRLKNLPFSSFKTYNSSKKPSNLTPEKFESLIKLSKNKNVAIQKSDKGNSVVLIDKIKIQKISSQPGVLYGVIKVPKKVIDGCPDFRPIFSAIVSILRDLTSNGYSVKDSFDFAK